MASDMDISPSGESRLPRVCNNCIRRKLKCDQRRPTCSRCVARKDDCAYTLDRRKPGPARKMQDMRRKSNRPIDASQGDRSTSRHPTDEATTSHVSHFVTSRGPSEDFSSPNIFFRAGASTFAPCSSFAFSESDGGSGTALRGPQQMIGPQQERDLLEKFFDLIRDANPIYSKTRFFEAYEEKRCNPDLVSTMVIITAKLTNYVSESEEFHPDSCMDRLLSSSLLDDETYGDSLNLDQFRKSCLLAMYDFHQNPGNQSWARVGRLVRMAYRQGLDRLEKLRSLWPDWAAVSEEDMNEWRAIWWHIYQLDSYSNLASGTPYMIDESLVSTSFMITTETVLLPSQPADVWQLLPVLTSEQEGLHANVHFVTITVLRQVGRIRRAYPLRSAEENAFHVTSAERSLSKVCLALPSGWLNSRRNVFAKETSIEHLSRLVTVLHLRMAQLLLSLILCDSKDENDWRKHWECVLEFCQDIVVVAESWDSSFSVQVDPAVAFIFFTALIFLTLHKKSTTGTCTNLMTSLGHGITILRLQLENLAHYWALTRLLLLAYKSYDAVLTDGLSKNHILLLLARFEAPLHPRWLQSLSWALEDLERMEC